MKQTNMISMISLNSQRKNSLQSTLACCSTLNLSLRPPNNRLIKPTRTFTSSTKRLDSKAVHSEPHVGEPSPYERFRRNKTFSVTDMSGPSWCEVQFDYGLRQKRNRKLGDRPTSFKSREGREIKVQKEVAVRNDAIQQSGKDIHKKLEKEIKADEVMIDTSSAEEKFAVRMLNLLWALDCILEFGFTREMPVFGIIHDQIIVGIIDEVDRVLTPTTASPKKTKKARSPSPSQPRITSFMSSTPTSSPQKPPPPPEPTGKYHLSLIDAKTRKANSIPSPANSYPSRIQLMLYHRLLSDLISTTYQFPFDYLWQKLDLDGSQPFSDKFKEQASQSNYVQANCLNDLARTWTQSMHQLDVSGVGDELKLVYIRQNKSKGKGGGRMGSAAEPLSMTEAQDIAQAIHASLADGDLDRAISESLLSSGQGTKGDGVKLSEQKAEGAIASKQPPVNQPAPEEDDSIPHKLDVESPEVIGTTVFKMDGSSLDDYLDNVLGYWHGEREPIGVSLANVGRCFSCEYRDDCEWRNRMAAALAKSTKSKNADGGKNPWS